MLRTAIIIVVIVSAGCSRGPVAHIEGSIEPSDQKYLKVWHIPVSTPRLIDSLEVDKEGRFRGRLSLAGEEPHFYQLGYSRGNFINLLLSPGERVNISFDGEMPADGYTISGSEGSEKVHLLDKKLAESKRLIDSLVPIYEEEVRDALFAEEPGPAEQMMYDVIEGQREHNIGFILDNLRSMASIKAMYQMFHEEAYVLGEEKDLQIMQLLTDTLSMKYPSSARVKAMADDLAREINLMRMGQMIRAAEEMEPVEIDPSLPSSDGTTIALSSLRGRYVLVNFWSFRSEEAVRENQLLESLYNRYRASGLEIYQISIDESRDEWQRVVNFEDFPWISVHDADGPRSRLIQLYNIREIPVSFLYNPQGDIIASHLRGREVTIRLSQIFGD